MIETWETLVQFLDFSEARETCQNCISRRFKECPEGSLLYVFSSFPLRLTLYDKDLGYALCALRFVVWKWRRIGWKNICKLWLEERTPEQLKGEGG